MLAGGMFFGRYFSHLFPLIEYRYWISGRPHSVWPLLREMLLPSASFSRHFSIWTVQAGWLWTSRSIVESNWLQLMMMILTALGLYWFLRRQFPTHNAFIPALGCALCYLFSVPLVDAAAWQATNHDKLAALLTITGLHVCLTLSRMPMKPGRVVIGNIGLFCIVVLAYNSKESAWCLVPAGCALVLSGRITTGGLGDLRHLRAWKETFALTLLPLLYSIWHVGIRLHFVLRESDQKFVSHVFGGNSLRNLYHFLLGFVNLSRIPNSWPAAVAASVTLVVITAALIRSLIKHRMGLVVPTMGLLMAMTIPARTLYDSPFYLLVPALFFWWLICAAAMELCEGMNTRRLWVSGLATAVVLLLQIANLLSPRAGWNLYMQLVEASNGFRASLPRIARTQPIDNPASICFAYPEEMFFAFQIIGNEEERGISPFLFPDVADKGRLAAYDSRISDFKYPAGWRATAVHGAVTFVFDRQLRITHVFGENIYLDHSK